MCGAEKIYAKNLCVRCYKRIWMRKWRREKRLKKEKTSVLKSKNLSIYENLGLECPHCRNTSEFYIDVNRAEIICKVCGLVLVSGARFTMFFPHFERRKT